MSLSTASSSTKVPEIIELLDNQYKADDSSNPFCFSVPGRVLKPAIAGLADKELNPSSLGMMEVCHEGFEITIFQLDKDYGEVFGLLSLKASGLGEFVCRRPMVRMLELDVIDTYLENNARDVDVIKVFTVDGSDTLCFTYERPILGVTRRCFLEVPFSNATNISKFPIFTYGFEMEIPANKLDPVIDSILQLIPRRRPPLVSVTIDTTLGIKTSSRPNTYEVVKTDEQKIVWVYFPYYESLKKTLSLADSCILWLASNPEKSVILRFDLQELGEFVYFKYAAEFFMSKDFPSMGTFRPLFPR